MFISSICYSVGECAYENKTLPLLTEDLDSKSLGSGTAAGVVLLQIMQGCCSNIIIIILAFSVCHEGSGT